MITVNGSSSVFPFDQKLVKNLTGHVKYTSFAMPEKNYWLGQNYYFRFNGSFDRGGVIVGIPSNAENGKTYRVDYSGKEDPLSFVLNQTTYLRADEIFKEVKSNSAIYTLDKYCYGVATVTMPGISGANDYFQLTVDYLFGNICKCSFEGCFEQGKIRVSGQFWVEE